MMMDNVGMLWGVAVVGGVLVLGIVLAVGQMKSSKADAKADPSTPGDDPAKGMG